MNDTSQMIKSDCLYLDGNLAELFFLDFGHLCREAVESRRRTLKLRLCQRRESKVLWGSGSRARRPGLA